MAKLYGGAYKPVIDYPKPKGARSKPLPGTWNPTNKANNVDPRIGRFNKAKALTVKTPKFRGSRGHGYAPVDLVPRRRAQGDCRRDIEDAEMRNTAYRPPNMSAFSTESEKDRLAEKFQYGGGAALPEEMTHHVSELPSDIRRRQAEADRVEKARSDRRKRLNGGVDPMAKIEVVETGGGQSAKDMLFDQVYGEIKERRAHQERMEAAGGGSKTRDFTAADISMRISKLSSIDPKRAAKVVEELYGS